MGVLQTEIFVWTLPVEHLQAQKLKSKLLRTPELRVPHVGASCTSEFQTRAAQPAGRDPCARRVTSSVHLPNCSSKYITQCRAGEGKWGWGQKALPSAGWSVTGEAEQPGGPCLCLATDPALPAAALLSKPPGVLPAGPGSRVPLTELSVKAVLLGGMWFQSQIILQRPLSHLQRPGVGISVIINPSAFQRPAFRDPACCGR